MKIYVKGFNFKSAIFVQILIGVYIIRSYADTTMDRSVRNHKLSIESVRGNIRISKKRSLVEYTYAIMKRMFHFSHVMVTTLRRVIVKFMFACFGYNVYAMKIMG
ncbi:hypothetical protein ACNF42_02425 [Cuniculiplasma sp. SKW3]|uniref:hypothetical protein n=1 Tax=Cuniculiplasma sp. SKW3 TaxID=3400170 RepID=UPI003FCF5327